MRHPIAKRVVRSVKMTRTDAWWMVAWGVTMLTCILLVQGYSEALDRNTSAVRALTEHLKRGR